MLTDLSLTWQILAVGIGFPLVLFAFGWSVLGRFSVLDDEERFAGAWGVGFAFVTGGQILGFMTHWHHPIFSWCLLALMILLTALCQFRNRRSWSKSADFWKLACLWTLGYAHLVAIQALLPEYVGGDWWGDWVMHYEASQVFLGVRAEDWAFVDQYTIASRTPLFNLVTAFVLSLAGDTFWPFQMTASLMNWVFPTVCYLVLRDRFGARIARLALLLAPLNLWMLHLAWFTWPKLLAAYFLVLGLYLYLRFLRLRRDEPNKASMAFLFFWISSLLGFMTHSVGVVYFAPLLVHALVITWHDWRMGLALKNLAWLALTGAVIVGPWHVWLLRRFGLEWVSASSPLTIMKPDTSQGLGYVIVEWLAALGQNVVTSLVPLADSTTRQAANPWAGIYLYATGFYFSSLTGAVTLSVSVFLGWLILARWRKNETFPKISLGPPAERHALWLFTALGCLGAMLLHPSGSVHGLAHNACFPSVIIWLSLAWALLAQAPRKVSLWVVAGFLTEFLLMFWSHIWWAVHDPGFLDSTGSNMAWKADDELVFLSDCLRLTYAWRVLTTASIQGILGFLLVRWFYQEETVNAPKYDL